MMKWLKRITLTLLIIILLVLGALAWILGTQSGLHFAINSAARWVPGLTINSVNGGWQDLRLTGVEYQMPGVDVNVGELSLGLNLSCLKDKQLCVEALGTRDVIVNVDTSALPPAQETPPSEPLTELNAPLPIYLNSLSLANTRVQIDDMALSLNEFTTAAQWEGRQITLKPTVINDLLVALPKTPEDGSVAAMAQDVKEVAATTPQAEPKTPQEQEQALADTIKTIFAKPLLAQLPEIIIPVDINVEGIEGKQLQVSGDTPVTINQLSFQANTQGQQVNLTRLSIDAPEGKVSLNGQITLDKQWPVNLDMQAMLREMAGLEEFKDQQATLSLQGAILDELKLALSLTGTVTASLDAQAELAKAHLPLKLTLESQKVRWPLTGDVQYQLNDTRLRLNGQTDNYDLSLRSNIEGQEIPPAKLTLDAKGNEEKIALTRLRLAALQGHADITGVADWSKAISWNALLTISGINTAKQYPDMPAKLDGRIATTGSLYGGSWQLRVPEITLDGNLKNNLIKARGNAYGNDSGQWNIPQLTLILGKNNLDIAGHLGDQWALDANINAPGLNGLAPGLAGVIKGKVNVRGDINKPKIIADINAQGIKWQDQLSVGSVVVKGDIQSDDVISGKLAITARQLKQADLIIRQLTLDAAGTEKQHKLTLKMDGEPVSGGLTLAGSFDKEKQQWQGTLNNTAFDTPVGEWRLNKAMALNLLAEKQQVTIGSHCWVNPNAQLCVPKEITVGESGSAAITLTRFDLAMIKPFLPPETALRGVFTGDATATWNAKGGLPKASVNLKGQGVGVKQNVDGTVLPIDFDAVTLNAGINNGKATLQWLISIAGNGDFKGHVNVADLEKTRQLSGTVDIDSLTLDLIKPFLGKGEIAQGSVGAQLRLGGNAQSPLLFGQFGINQLKVVGHWIPFDITKGNVDIRFNGATSDLSGRIETPEGYLNLTGNADWRKLDEWRAVVAANGNKLRVSLPPMVRIDVNPDLVFEANPHLLKLDGRIDIPWARIVVQELPESAVSASSDEVMLDKELQPIAPKQTSIPIQSNLAINIGDDVTLDAFGLKARLTGALKVAQSKQGLGLNGQVDIPRGEFKAYGQDLQVRKGQILFSGPVDQPYLNIEAIRNPDNTADNVIAGVKVTGLADKPKVEIFSEPAKTQQEALSYLLRGEGLASGDSDSAQMTAMLIGLGVGQSGQLVGRIGETFGISDLALDTQGVGDSSQVVVSGKITDDLQVKYGMGIFDSLATLTLRYRLMPRLYLQAVSGMNQAIDLLYQFEF
ncbi:autotransporter assembly complex protein TamB [Proteus mirabilis]|uniref:autotransporter assembly complex protein TamB n=1 Tax=Proteus mirabilis TaxID=584 RepID=UPI00217E5B8D|nr:translocation/assembly module TamB domain-containing protein [Proteus mirabilis]MCS6723857.1 translocation/assembly module TamB [Proteus mirabilis]